jgi:peptide/nickel transport system substrate-binding protein
MTGGTIAVRDREMKMTAKHMTSRAYRTRMAGAVQGKKLRPILGATALALSAALQPALAEDNSSHFGGTMKLLGVSSEGTLDPHINYTARFWQLFIYTHDGLMAFKKVAGPQSADVVPDLAEEMPAISNEGKTYTFKLRKGIKFSNGKDLTTDDVVASLQRIFKVSSPTSGSFYSGIIGADKCLADAASCTLAGGVVADPLANTITINLVAPDAEFLYKLAVPHAAIVPADTVTKDAGNAPIPGTGSYMFESYDPNSSLILTRNPYFNEWSRLAQPKGYPDRIEYAFGGTEEAAVNAILNGQADFMYEPVPADRLSELSLSRPELLHVAPLNAWWYAPMNTNLAPFNDVRVRQAMNYAVDRDALVSVFGGPALASPVCTVLPPDMPGFTPRCDYSADPGESWSAPDLEKAKALVEASGTKGEKVTVVSDDSSTSRAVGTYLQTVLSDLGYEASVQSISGDIQFVYIQNTKNNVQISVSQWYQDYPAPSNFLHVLFGCDSFTPGSDSSVNISGFCDKAIDGRMKAAMALATRDPEAALKQWGDIDYDVMKQAPAIPLYTPKDVDLVSSRLGNYEFSNQFHWLIGNSWVQ